MYLDVKEEKARFSSWYFSMSSLITSLFITVFTLIHATHLPQEFKGDVPESFFENVLWGLIIFLTSYFAGVIGNLLRKVAMPNAFFSTGFWDTIGKRLFWNIGPQTIASFVTGYLVFFLLTGMI